MATKAKRSKTDIPVNISGLYMKERKSQCKSQTWMMLNPARKNGPTIPSK